VQYEKRSLGLAVDDEHASHITTYDPARLVRRPIVTRDHCFSCCAGAGSSCQGALEAEAQ
jgi:hypothetical protein